METVTHTSFQLCIHYGSVLSRVGAGFLEALNALLRETRLISGWICR